MYDFRRFPEFLIFEHKQWEYIFFPKTGDLWQIIPGYSIFCMNFRRFSEFRIFEHKQWKYILSKNVRFMANYTLLLAYFVWFSTFFWISYFGTQAVEYIFSENGRFMANYTTLSYILYDFRQFSDFWYFWAQAAESLQDLQELSSQKIRDLIKNQGPGKPASQVKIYIFKNGRVYGKICHI